MVRLVQETYRSLCKCFTYYSWPIAETLHCRSGRPQLPVHEHMRMHAYCEMHNYMLLAPDYSIGHHTCRLFAAASLAHIVHGLHCKINRIDVLQCGTLGRNESSHSLLVRCVPQRAFLVMCIGYAERKLERTPPAPDTGTNSAVMMS